MQIYVAGIMTHLIAHDALHGRLAAMSPPATHAVQLVVLTVAFIAAAVGIVALPEDMLPIN